MKEDEKAGHVVNMSTGEIYIQELSGKPEGKTQHGTLRQGQEHNFKWILKK
jgi:hypothetical protein